MSNDQIIRVGTKPDGIDMTNRFVNENFVACGWGDTGSLAGMSKEQIRQALEQTFSYTGQKLATTLGVLNCFVRTAKEGNTVMVSDGDYAHVGFLENYYYDENLHKRGVQWVAKVKKSELNPEVQSFLKNRTSCTKFKHPYYVAQLDMFISPSDKPVTNDEIVETTVTTQYTDIAQKALKQLESVIDSQEVSTDVKAQAAIEILKFLNR